MAKKINAFKNMCQEDQVALLKGGCTEIMILRSAMNYDPKKQTWKVRLLNKITTIYPYVSYYFRYHTVRNH